MPLLSIILALAFGHPSVATAPEAPKVEQHIVIQEEEPVVTKPIPNTEPVVKTSACNCYHILTENFASVPPMDQIVAMATSTMGNVAVFMYPATPAFPNGVPHVAISHGIQPDGSILIEEYNYHSCAHSSRTISPTDKRLVGFITLPLLSPSLSHMDTQNSTF